MRKYSKIFFCLLFPSFLVAQVHDVKFKSGNFKGNPNGFKYAMQKLNEGNQHIQNGEYGAALIAYLAADSINPSNADLNAKIGVCYLNTVSKAKCLTYFRLAHQIDKSISKRIDFFLARGYQLNSQWDSAMMEYKLALKSASAQDKDEINKCTNECLSGMDLCARPVKVTMENMGDNINSPYSDFRPLVSADGKEIVFASHRHSNMSTEINPVTGEYTSDVFISHNRNGVWDTAEILDPPVNTVENDEGVYLGPDGSALYLFRENRGGDIYKTGYSEKMGWSLPVAMSDTINSIYAESSLCLSPDGKTIYFASARPGGIGGKDIYTSTKVNDSTWGSPVNMGNNINTPYDEDGVFMNPDGKTLFFSSKGHNSMGGYDIFMTTLDNGNWSVPQNLGYPINTPDDDVYFTTSDNGYYGYYARNTDNNKLDIYRVTLTAFMPKEWIVKGAITDSVTHEKLKVGLEFFDKAQGNNSPFGADSVMGEYSLTLPAKHSYTVRFAANGYKTYSIDINVPDTAMYSTLIQNITLAKSAPTVPTATIVSVIATPTASTSSVAAYSSSKVVSSMKDSCVPSLSVLMERFKGVVKDTSVMRSAVAHMDTSFCLKSFRFSIQLGLFHSTQKFSYTKYVKKANVEKLPDGTSRITSGSFTTYEEAHKELEILKDKGLKDAFIIGTYNGKRYVLKDLLHPAN